MDHRIKVLHIITHLPIGGAQDNTLLTVERLDRKNYNITLLSGPEGNWRNRAGNIKDIKVIYMTSLVRPIRLVRDFQAMFKMIKLMRESKYDIVHTHQAKAGVLGRVAAWIVGVPVIVHTYHSFPFHDYMTVLERFVYIRIEKIIAKLTDQLIAVSELNLQKGVKLGIASQHKFLTIYSGIDFSRFDISVNVSDVKKSLDIPDADQIVGMIGRLSEQKAPQYLVQAIPLVLEKFPNTTFLFVGDGNLRKQLETIADECGIGEKIKFLGFREDIPTLLHIMDIFVLTSLWEGLGRSLTEAMFVGKPVIATAVEGVPELVENGETGLLISPKDVAATAASLLQLLASPEKRKQLGRNAHEKVISNFNAALMVRKIDQLYHNLLVEKGVLID